MKIRIEGTTGRLQTDLPCSGWVRVGSRMNRSDRQDDHCDDQAQVIEQRLVNLVCSRGSGATTEAGRSDATEARVCQGCRGSSQSWNKLTFASFSTASQGVASGARTADRDAREPPPTRPGGVRC